MKKIENSNLQNILLELFSELQHLPISKGHWKAFRSGSAGEETMAARSVYQQRVYSKRDKKMLALNPYPTAFPYGNGMVLHFYQ